MIQIVYLNDENSLTHHGIKGMKWGVRRFQNYDGTRIKNGSSITKSERTRSYDYSKYGGGKGNWTETTYTHKSSSGRKILDSDVKKELDRVEKYVKENIDKDYESDIRDIYGGDLSSALSSEGIEFTTKLVDHGKDYAEKWLANESKLKDYDYKIVVNEEVEINGAKSVGATLKLFGDSYEFSAGVEKDYSDEEYFIDKNKQKRISEKTKLMESSKEYKDLHTRMDKVQKEMDKMYDKKPSGTNIYDLEGYSELEDEWYELSDKETTLRKKYLGSDY